MDALSDLLQPYKNLVGTLAGIVTIGQMFSGSFICYDVYKQKNTRGVTIVPFVGGLIMGILNLQFGFIIRDNTMILVNLAGLTINSTYLSIFYYYSENKMRVWGQMGIGGAVAAALTTYIQLEDPQLIQSRLGTIITTLMFCLLASPLLNLGNIIKNQSTEGIPFPIIMSGSLVTSMWLLYGIIIKNWFLVLQNAVAFKLCAIQLSLCVMYPSKSKAKTKAEKDQ